MPEQKTDTKFKDPTVQFQEKIRGIRKDHPLVYDLYYRFGASSITSMKNAIEFAEKITEKEMRWKEAYEFFEGNNYDIFQFVRGEGIVIQKTEDPAIFRRVVRFYNIVDFIFEFEATQNDIANFIRQDYIGVLLMEMDNDDAEIKVRALGEDYWINLAQKEDPVKFITDNFELSEKFGKWIQAEPDQDFLKEEVSLQEVCDLLQQLDDAAMSIENVGPYDYSELEQYIREKCDTRKNFGKLIGLSEPALSKRLNNQCYFLMPEIEKAMEILNKDKSMIGELFFKKKTWKAIMGV